MMINTWIVYAIIASIFQVFRNSLQKKLQAVVPNIVVTWARFFFGLPIIAIYALIINKGTFVINVSTTFWVLATIGACCQIAGTLYLLICFEKRSFAIGIAFSKLEAPLAAIIGLIIFSDSLSFIGIFAILLSTYGIIACTLDEKKFSINKIFTQFKQGQGIQGLLCGLGFAASSVFFRHASLQLSADNALINGINTLMLVIIIQTCILTPYIIAKHKTSCIKTFSHLPIILGIGIFGISASVGWFSAFNITNAAYVKSIGQIELLLSIFITYYVFKESLSSNDRRGIIAILISIILLSLF